MTNRNMQRLTESLSRIPLSINGQISHVKGELKSGGMASIYELENANGETDNVLKVSFETIRLRNEGNFLEITPQDIQYSPENQTIELKDQRFYTLEQYSDEDLRTLKEYWILNQLDDSHFPNVGNLYLIKNLPRFPGTKDRDDKYALYHLGITMEKLEDHNMDNLIDQIHQDNPEYSEAQRSLILRLMEDCHELAPSLQKLHQFSVLHRDLKPKNIGYRGKTPIILDFGISLVGDDTLLDHGPAMGSLSFVPPEQLARRDIPNDKADQFAIAMTLVDILSPREPIEYRKDTRLNSSSQHILQEQYYYAPDEVIVKAQEFADDIANIYPHAKEVDIQTLATFIANATIVSPNKRYKDLRTLTALAKEMIRSLNNEQHNTAPFILAALSNALRTDNDQNARILLGSLDNLEKIEFLREHFEEEQIESLSPEGVDNEIRNLLSPAA